MFGPPRYGAVRLLAVLWAVAGCGASQSPADPSSAQHYRDGSLGALVSQAVKSATEPLFVQLATRMDRLDSKLDGLAIRVDNQDHKLDGLATRLNNRDSELDGLVTGLSTQDSKLDGLIVRLDNQDSKLDGLVSGLSTQDSKLDGLVSGLYSQDSKLDGLVSGLSTQDTKLDGLDTRLANQSSELDRLVSGLSTQDSKLDGLDTRLANQSSELDTQLNRLSAAMTPLPRDCSDLPAGTPSGVHLLQLGLDRRGPAVPAYCDLHNDGGNWTVVQRRADVQPRQDFYLGWTDYKQGFGELDAEFWWGLDNMWKMTSPPGSRYELRINLADFDGEKRHAVYQKFRISSESDGYRLAATDYTGDAGDSLKFYVGERFTTKDRDQDGHSTKNCAVIHKSGWWYEDCTGTNLNGPNRPCSGTADCITWFQWKGSRHSLKSVEMKIRPV